MTNIPHLAKQVIKAAAAANIGIATAESCTGGLIGAALTDVPGASAVFEGGLITYSNDAKHFLLDVPEEMLAEHGAVSGEVAEAMAQGALTAMEGRAALAVAVTGIAGPDGGTPEKPVGLVWFGIATPDAARAEKVIFDGRGRQEIRKQTVLHALELLLSEIKKA